MKPKYLAALFSAVLVWPAVSSQAAVSVSVFYESLDPYGEWVSTSDYGYVFHPAGVDADWRPYTDGSWVYTDAGWTWTSEEPFGWATYHYGRWADLDGTGWVWVPGTEWAPAWVSWRSSDDYVGWAPLPPEARFEARLGFHDWVDTHFDIGPASFSFVRFQDFGSPRLRTVVVQPRENITIINNTRNITNITYVNNVVVNNGPQFDVVSKRSERPVRRFKLERNTEVAFTGDNARAGLRSQVQGDTLRIPAPDVQQQSDRDVAPRKVARKLDRVAVNRGWKNAGDPAKVQQMRAKMASEVKAPADLPKVKLAGSDEANVPAAPPKPGVAEGKPGRRERPDGDQQPPPAGRPSVAVGEPNPSKPDQPDGPGGKPRVDGPGRGDVPPPAAEVGTPSERRGPPGKRPIPDGPPGNEERPDASRTPGKPPIPREAPAPNDAQRGPAEKPARPEVDRPERPERPQRPDQGRLQRPERPGINREERGDRPNAGPAERPRPEAGRPEKPAAPERAERPEANRERPQPGAAQRPPQKNPKAPEAGEGKPGKDKERGPAGKEGKRKDGEI